MHHRSKSRVILGIVLAVLLIAGFGGGLYFFEHMHDGEGRAYDDEDVSKFLVIGDKKYEITHNIESYLLIGTDDSGNVDKEGTDEYRGQLADFLLLFVMDKTDNTYGMLQIDRNTMTTVMDIDREGKEIAEIDEQICTAHWYGGNPQMGCENTVDAASRLLGGFDIDGYYSIHMSDVGTLNHAVGGVEVTLDQDFSASDPQMTAGKTLTLSDAQAEIYVRGRMKVGDGTNAARMQRQLNYMQKFQAKAKSKGLMGEDSTFLNELYEDLQDTAVTNIPENRLSVIANEMYKGEDQGILVLDGKTKIGETLNDGIEHEEFYATTDSIAETMMTLCGIDASHIQEDTGE